MLKYMYKLVYPWAKSNKFQILINRIVGLVTNMIYPIYCKVIPLNYKKSDKIIVSLTSFPARIEKVYLCINSLMRQDRSDFKVILWLAESQFPQRKELPKRLLELENKGLEIRFCDDIKSYKKIFYTAQEYVDKIIITVDDDTLYPEDLITNMLKTHQENKGCVVCYRAHKICFDNLNAIQPYKKWLPLSPDIKGPSKGLVAIGVGGILYPKNTFENIIFDYDIIQECAPTTDDIWLKIITIKKNMPVVKVSANSKEWFTIRTSQKSSLKEINVENDNKNDRSLKNLMQTYNLSGKDFLDINGQENKDSR